MRIRIYRIKLEFELDNCIRIQSIPHLRKEREKREQQGPNHGSELKSNFNLELKFESEIRCCRNRGCFRNSSWKNPTGHLEIRGAISIAKPTADTAGIRIQYSRLAFKCGIQQLPTEFRIRI